MFTQNQPMASRQSVQFCNSNRGDPGQALELTPPRGPNFRPETSGLMVIALTTTKRLSTDVHLAAAWCTVCIQACSKQQCAHLIQQTCRIGIVGGWGSNAVLLKPTLGTVCLPPPTNSILRPTDKYNPHMHKHGMGDCACIGIS